MALTIRPNLIKGLQTAFPRGTPFDHHELTKLGVSSALAHHYLKSGWLLRLGRGVFMYPNDTLSREGCLKFLSRQVAGFHVGGKTALAWRGVRHNLPAREPLSLWGGGQDQIAGMVPETVSLALHGAKPIFIQAAKTIRFTAVAGNT